MARTLRKVDIRNSVSASLGQLRPTSSDRLQRRGIPFPRICRKFCHNCTGYLIQNTVGINVPLWLLWLAYIEVAWLLSAYRAPTIVWLGTLIVTFYLAWAGMDAIALASIWVVAVFSISAIRHAWLWNVPSPLYQLEPLLLLIIWLLSLGLILLTARTHRHLKQQCDRGQVTYHLLIPICLGLTCGILLYNHLTLPLLLSLLE